MDNLLITKFEDFINEAYNPMAGSMAVIERDKSLIKGKEQNQLKIKQGNEKIKIKVAKPKDQGELIRYEFKVVTGNVDLEQAKSDAFSHLANLCTDQINKGHIKPNMVGFLNLEKAQQRLVGDYVTAGVLSFYDSSTLPNLSAIQAKWQVNMPNQPSAPSNNSNRNGTGAVVEADITPTSIPIYDFVDIAKAKAPGVKFNMATITNVQKNTIPEPDNSNPATQPSTQPTSQQTSTPNQTISYANLAQSMTVNPLVKDLQAKILALGQIDQAMKPAADILTAYGGPDGKYGNATAQAIAHVLNGNMSQPITMITPEQSTALIAKFKNVTKDQVNNIITQATPITAATVEPTQSTSTNTKPSSIPSVSQQVDTTNTKVPKLNF